MKEISKTLLILIFMSFELYESIIENIILTIILYSVCATIWVGILITEINKKQ